MWSLKTGGLLTQVNYFKKCILGGLKGKFLNTGSLLKRRWSQRQVQLYTELDRIKLVSTVYTTADMMANIFLISCYNKEVIA